MKNSIGQERNPRAKLSEKSDLFFVNEWKKKVFICETDKKNLQNQEKNVLKGKTEKKKCFQEKENM